MWEVKDTVTSLDEMRNREVKPNVTFEEAERGRLCSCFWKVLVTQRVVGGFHCESEDMQRGDVLSPVESPDSYSLLVS